MSDYNTHDYEGMIAETITIQSRKGDFVNAYLAKPLGKGPFPSIVLVHHLPGWDELYKEFTRKFAHHGFIAICPDLFNILYVMLYLRLSHNSVMKQGSTAQKQKTS